MTGPRIKPNTEPDVRSVAGFRRWLADAAHGEAHTYFVGHLARAIFSPPINDLRASVMRAADAGHVALVQRRVRGEGFAYEAQRTGRAL